MADFERELNDELSIIRKQQLHRELRQIDSPQGPRIQIEGREFLNFSSNDYLGLANHPALKEAAIRALARYGTGAGASRLICGSLAPFHELEEALAAFKRREAALTFSTGYATALAAICSLLGKDDVIVLDRLVHASIVDGARLSGARLQVFPHNDLDALDRVLRKTQARTPGSRGSAANRPPRVLIATESVFSMDGDRAPLRQLVELKDKYGAWLMVDEAHATGILGTAGRGLAEAEGVQGQIEIQMGTLGKAVGASGGFICGSKRLIELLINRARSFIFSTAPVPAAAAAATAGLRVIQSETGDDLRTCLWDRIAQLHSILGRWAIQPQANGAAGTPLPHPLAAQRSGTSQAASAILPLLIGEESAALQIASTLRERGVYVPAIRYPTVAHGEARLRFTVTAAHGKDDLREFQQRVV